MYKYTLPLALIAMLSIGCGSSDATKADATPAKSDVVKPADASAEKPAEGKSIVGHWHSEADKPDGANFDLDLNEDKSLLWASTQKLKIQDQTVNLEIVMHGTYTGTDKDLNVTFTDVKINGVPPEVAKSTEEPLKAGLNKPSDAPVTWKGDKEAEITIGGQAITYKLVDKK